MIHLNVINSQDVNAPGEYEFNFDIISIGKSLRNDLIILEKKIIPYAILLIVENNQLFLQTTSVDFFCQVNNTKLSGRKKLNIGDEVLIGATLIKIINFNSTCTQFDFAKLYNDFITNHPSHQYVLDALNNELEYLEKKQAIKVKSQNEVF